MKIYTKTGDKGQTSLFGGKRVSKSHLRIDAYGTTDELNSYIGWLADMEVNAEAVPLLRSIQQELFIVGAELAADPDKPGLKKPKLSEEKAALLEQEIDRMNEQLEPLRYFILPGGHRDISLCHVARTVCRRAERIVVALAQETEIHPLIIVYLNRLSDYLFVLARYMAHKLGVTEIAWIP